MLVSLWNIDLANRFVWVLQGRKFRSMTWGRFFAVFVLKLKATVHYQKVRGVMNMARCLVNAWCFI